LGTFDQTKLLDATMVVFNRPRVASITNSLQVSHLNFIGRPPLNVAVCSDYLEDAHQAITCQPDHATTLIDLDLHFGNLALSLDLEPGRGLREALENPERTDSMLLAAAMVNDAEKLPILATEQPLEDLLHFDPSAVAPLLTALAEDYDCLVVDLPRNLDGMARQVIAAADTTVIVTDLSLSALRDTHRLVELSKSLESRSKPLVVADGNQYFNRPGPRLVESLEILAEAMGHTLGKDGRAPEATRYYSRMPEAQKAQIRHDAILAIMEDAGTVVRIIEPEEESKRIEQLMADADERTREVLERYGGLHPVTFGHCGYPGLCVRGTTRAFCIGCPFLVRRPEYLDRVEFVLDGYVKAADVHERMGDLAGARERQRMIAELRQLRQEMLLLAEAERHGTWTPRWKQLVSGIET